MNMVEKVKALCKERNIAVSRLEKECGFANGYIRNLREGKMPADRLDIIEKYFGVDHDYFIDAEYQKNDIKPLEKLEAKDIELLNAYNNATESTKHAVRLILGIEK